MARPRRLEHRFILPSLTAGNVVEGRSELAIAVADQKSRRHVEGGVAELLGRPLLSGIERWWRRKEVAVMIVTALDQYEVHRRDQGRAGTTKGQVAES